MSFSSGPRRLSRAFCSKFVLICWENMDHFEIVHMKDIQGLEIDSKVRFLGRITQIAVEERIVEATWGDSRITISTHSMGDSRFSVGGIYEWMGRVKLQKVDLAQNFGEAPSSVYVHGTLHRDVENLDLDLFEEVEELKRAFLAKQLQR